MLGPTNPGTQAPHSAGPVPETSDYVGGLLVPDIGQDPTPFGSSEQEHSPLFSGPLTTLDYRTPQDPSEAPTATPRAFRGGLPYEDPSGLLFGPSSNRLPLSSCPAPAVLVPTP